jgi:ubiquitin carboxyl-terminal hydrolase 25/28
MIESQFSDLRHLPYRLQAVFVHHGSVAFGHYYIYIYDFEKDVWRKYNDTTVTEVQNVAEIFQHREEQNPPTPYFLVYVNDNLKHRLVDPVCREIAEPHPHPETGLSDTMDMSPDKPVEDVEMNDPPTYRESMADPAGMNTHDSSSHNSLHENSASGTSKPADSWERNESPTNNNEKIQW